jgi:hypothetical protein
LGLDSKFFGKNSVLAHAIYVLNRFSVNWAKKKIVIVLAGAYFLKIFKWLLSVRKFFWVLTKQKGNLQNDEYMYLPTFK